MKNTYLETTEKTTKLIMTHCEKGETLKLITGINKIISEVINKTRKETLNEIIREYQDNELNGKNYDFYFSIRAKIDELNKLKK